MPDVAKVSLRRSRVEDRIARVLLRPDAGEVSGPGRELIEARPDRSAAAAFALAGTFGSMPAALPAYASSADVERPLWKSPPPTTPNLYGLTPTFSSIDEPSAQRIAHIAAVRLARLARHEQRVEDLEVRELVVRRERGHGLGLTLVLRDLADGFVEDPALRVLLVDRLAVAVVPVVHQAVAGVAVVRNRERFDAVLACVLEVAPQIFRPSRVDRRERQRRMVALKITLRCRLYLPSGIELHS